MECRWFSGTAVMVRTSSIMESAQVGEAVAAHLPTARCRAGLDYLLVEPARPDPELLDRVAAVVARLRTYPRTSQSTGSGRVHHVAVDYDGADLVHVAETMGLTLGGLVAAHVGTTWRVATLGFAPGFGYLIPDAATVEWSLVSRLPTPRRSVPAGSVAVAAGMSCVYPAGMPGGWPLIGRCDIVLFDPGNLEDPSLLRAGDKVAFRDVRTQA